MSDKEASGNESSDDTECPTCGRDDFESSKGMFHHHSCVHNERLDERRFWSRVTRGDDEDCWEWEGSLFECGYGLFWRDGENAYAHRLAYEYAVKDPGDELVLHHCDNKPCVNPNHLYLGDYKDNKQDAIERGQSARGERHGDAKLTADDVAEIRQRYAEEDIFQYELAEEFGIDRSHTSKIIRGEKWAHTFEE